MSLPKYDPPRASASKRGKRRKKGYPHGNTYKDKPLWTRKGQRLPKPTEHWAKGKDKYHQQFD